MGQRSQIFVRFTNGHGKKELVARYYGWNYSDSMISRARYTIDWLKENYMYLAFSSHHHKRKIPRILDANFDMVDVTISTDILEEYISDNDMHVKECPEDKQPTLNEYLFEIQDNNDGKLLLDVLADGTVEYAFLDTENKILTPGEYMGWDENKDWKIPNEHRSEDVIKKTIANIDDIKINGVQMDENDVKEFLTADYSYSLKDYHDTF